MTLDQIQMFLAVAKYQNFTKASELLFVTQPNISRAISGLESELNMQLFVRKANRVKLTPAGNALYEDFSKAMNQIQEGVRKATDINHGFLGNVAIGVLEGTDVSDFMPKIIAYFRSEFPNIKITLISASFRELLYRLYDGTIDIALSLEFNLKDHNMIEYAVLEETEDNLVVPNVSPLFHKDTITVADLDCQDVIIISPEDLDLTNQQIIDLFRGLHIGPVIHYAPDLRTAILWMEAGIGSVFLFSRSIVSSSENIRRFTIQSPWNTGLSIGIHTENDNKSARLVYEYCKKLFVNKAD